MRYQAIVTREGGDWLAEVRGVEGGHTWSPYGLAKLDTYVREVAALMDDLPEGVEPTLQFEWVFEVTDDDLVDAVAEARGASRAEVLARGWSLADVAAMLNVPADRVTHVPPGDPAHAAHG